MTKPSILITGASGDSYGAGIAKELDAEFEVYTMQRNPGLTYSKWYDHDLNMPESTPRVLQEMDKDVGPISDKPSFQAVVHCSSVQTKQHLGTITSIEMSAQFNANVSEPLKIIGYMLQFGLLEWTGKVIFLEDLRNFGPDLAVYHACKKSLPLFVEAMQNEWPATLDIRYVCPLLKSRAGAVKHAAKLVNEILIEEYDR